MGLTSYASTSERPSFWPRTYTFFPRREEKNFDFREVALLRAAGQVTSLVYKKMLPRGERKQTIARLFGRLAGRNITAVLAGRDLLASVSLLGHGLFVRQKGRHSK